MDRIKKALLAVARVYDLFPRSWLVVYERMNLISTEIISRLIDHTVAKLVKRGTISSETARTIATAQVKALFAIEQAIVGLEAGESFESLMENAWNQAVSETSGQVDRFRKADGGMVWN